MDEKMDVYTQRRIFVLFILIVVVLGVSLIVIQCSVSEPDIKDFTYGTVTFASGVDDDFKYTAKTDFKVGEEMWAYAEVWNYPVYYDQGDKSKGEYVLCSMDVRTFDSAGNLVSDFTGNLASVLDYVTSRKILYFAAPFNTTTLAPGTYTMEFTFTDLVEFLPMMTTKEFRMVK